MSGSRRRLILFARHPVPGRVKTRLIPALGADGAAALHRRLVLRTLRTADASARRAEARLEIRFAGGSENAMSHWLGDSWWCRPQDDGDLGQRMAAALAASFEEGSAATVLIGSDCPRLSPAELTAAFDALERGPAVFGPATDGGYYLVGLTQPMPALFHGLPWGTETVLAKSLDILAQSSVTPSLLPPLSDLDRPEDLPAWRSIAQAEEADLGRVSVIVPAFNEGGRLAACLQSAQRGCPHELIVVDGGSRDDTVAVAQATGAAVLRSGPGRARQMNAGAARASGNGLLFLHADTRLPAGWPGMVAGTLGRPGVAAGAFRFQIAEDFAGRRLLEWSTHLRSRWGQSPYGDQALFLKRSVFEELGAYADLPIMEDYELVSRLRRQGLIVTRPEAAITSGRRWTQRGLVRTSLLNKLVIAGFRIGVSPKRLAELYRRG
jgi:rSAM/selenodomain-associated transferase 2/rSAM/selenodomain-associated transferase 1